jgi:hypothetical protein
VLWVQTQEERVETGDIYLFCERFEVFTAVTMKNVVFWNVALSRACINRSFGGTYHLHLQGRKIRKRGTSISRWLQTEPPVSYIRTGRVGHMGKG